MAGTSFEEKIAKVFAYKTTKKYPEGMSKGQRFCLRRLGAKFSLEAGGTLFHSSKGRKVVVVHTRKEAFDLFTQYHASPQGGHQGIHKTRLAMGSRYYWPGMTSDIAEWVAQCPDCQRLGKVLTADTTLKSMKATRQWEMLGMDLIGPMPETKRGYKYILTVVDYFSKWVEAFPLRNKSSSVVARKIWKLFLKYGCPRRILTDRGSEFNNTLNLELCNRFNIQRSFTSPYHLQTNGLAERTNNSIKTGLAKCVGDKLNTWDEYLPPVLFSLRSKPNMSTQMSPVLVMMGREALFPDQVPDNFTVPDVIEPSEEEIRQSMKDFLSRKEADAALCLKNISKAQERQQRQYSKRHISKFGKTTFEVGQSVLLQNAGRKTRQGGSLEPTYRGPYKLTGVVGKRVTLEAMSGKRLGTTFSIGHLKAFKGPAQVVSENISEDNVEIQTAVDSIPKNSPPQNLVENSGDECHSSADCFKRSIDVLKMEEEECGVKTVQMEEGCDGVEPSMEVWKTENGFRKVQCDSCKRWAHIPCIPGGINEEILHDEHKEY